MKKILLIVFSLLVVAALFLYVKNGQIVGESKVSISTQGSSSILSLLTNLNEEDLQILWTSRKPDYINSWSTQPLSKVGNVVVKLTEEPQRYDVFATLLNNQKVVLKSFSPEINYDTGNIVLLVQFNKQFYPDELTARSELNKYILRSVYIFANPEVLGDVNRSNDLDIEILKIIQNEQSLLYRSVESFLSFISTPVGAQCSGFITCGNYVNYYVCSNRSYSCSSGSGPCGPLGAGYTCSLDNRCESNANEKSCGIYGSESQCNSGGSPCSASQCQISRNCSWNGGSTGGGGYCGDGVCNNGENYCSCPGDGCGWQNCVCSGAVQTDSLTYTCNANGTATVNWTVDPGIAAGDPAGGWHWTFNGASGSDWWGARNTVVTPGGGSNSFDIIGYGSSGSDCLLQHRNVIVSCAPPAVPACWVNLQNGLSSIDMTYGGAPITVGIGYQNGNKIGVYSSPVAPINPGGDWSTWVYGNYPSGAISFSCPGIGSYFLVCNTANSVDNILCSGNPFTSAFPNCGPSDRRTINCLPAAPTCSACTVTGTGSVSMGLFSASPLSFSASGSSCVPQSISLSTGPLIAVVPPTSAGGGSINATLNSGATAGNSSVTALATMQGGVQCSATIPVTVNPPACIPTGGVCGGGLVCCSGNDSCVGGVCKTRVCSPSALSACGQGGCGICGRQQCDATGTGWNVACVQDNNCSLACVPSDLSICTIVNNPLSVNLIAGGGNSTFTSSVSVTGGSATVTSITYGIYDTNIAQLVTSLGNTATVRGLANGLTASWARAQLSNGNSCVTGGAQDTDLNVSSIVVPTNTPVPTPTPTPLPCAVNLVVSPSNRTIEIGDTGSFNVQVNQLTATCSNLSTTVSTNPPGVVTTSGPGNLGGTLVVTGVTPGTANIIVTVRNNGIIVGTQTVTTTISCTPPKDPTNLNVIDAFFKIRLNWNDNSSDETGFQIEKSPVQFVAPLTNPQVVPANTTTFLVPESPNLCVRSNDFRIRAVNSTKPISCSYSGWATQVGGCEDYEAWFGAQGGGVMSGGEVRSKLPSWAPGPFDIYSNIFLNNDPESGDTPGMAIGSSFGSAIKDTNANTRQWLVQGIPNMSTYQTILDKSENSYISMLERVSSRATPFTYNGNINAGGANNRIDLGGGKVITVMRSAGSITIPNGGLNVGDSRVLMFVDGDLNINGNISINNGFFAVFASGNIIISPRVGDSATTFDVPSGFTRNLTTDIRDNAYTPHIEGIYFAGGNISTGGADTTLGRTRLLRIDGSLVAMGVINLQRVIKSPLPAEYVVFRPDFTYTLSQIGLRRKTYQELLNP